MLSDAFCAVAADHRERTVAARQTLQGITCSIRYRRRAPTMRIEVTRFALDARFRDEGAAEPGVRTDNKRWPHGRTAAGIPHGAVFGQAPFAKSP